MGTLLSHQIISWGWAYTPISLIGHDNLSKALLLKPIGSSIDLISPLEKYSLILSHFDLKSTPNHGNSIPLPPTTTVRVDGNFHGFGDYLCSWRLFVLDKPPKTSIFAHLRVKADQLT